MAPAGNEKVDFDFEVVFFSHLPLRERNHLVDATRVCRRGTFADGPALS